MVAAADRLFVPGPNPREVWLTLSLSILFHGLLSAGIILVPRFQVGTYFMVPVSYTVNLVDAPPAERAPAPTTIPPGAATQAPAPTTIPPAAAARPAPAPTEELTLPGRQTSRKPAPTPEPSLRPPSVTGRETLRPGPSPPAPIAPPSPAVPGPAPIVTQRATGAGAVAGTGKGSGVEVASPSAGSGTGGSVLASYLTLVDWKIQQNWVPVGAARGPETVVVVRFRVLRSGQVRDFDLEAGSGNASLDASALRAIRQSLPLPPFPNLLTEPSLDLRYRFVMERG